jgi:hypothetical protein
MLATRTVHPMVTHRLPGSAYGLVNRRPRFISSHTLATAVICADVGQNLVVGGQYVLFAVSDFHC